MTGKYQDKGPRPPCPSCNTPNPISNGAIKWYCPGCGKQWLKIKRNTSKRDPAPHLPPFEERPQCPSCSYDHVMSEGIYWTCSECGRRFVKNPRTPEVIELPDTNPFELKEV